MKKVVLEFDKIRDLHSGLGQYCFHLGKELSLLPHAFDFHFFLPKEKFGIFGQDFHYEKSSKFKRLSSLLTPDADIWHAVHQDSPYIPPKSSKVVLTIHDLNFLFKDHRDPKVKLMALERKVKRSDRIVFISEFTKKICSEHLDLGNKKTEVIYNGISLSYRRKWDGASRSPGKGRPFLFTIGIISEKKNFHVLVSMMEKLPHLDLFIAGRKDSLYAKEMETEIDRLGLSGRVHLVGNITEDEKLKFYEHCQGFVFPSKQEGFGMPVIEAMSLGKPVFLSTYTSLPEVGGPHAFYFKSFEAQDMANTLLDGLALYNQDKELKNKLKNWTKKFSWEETALRYLQIYQTL
ncbi:MAG: glycosyltransferase family 4 protein [Bacteriovoracaceae bacterium]